MQQIRYEGLAAFLESHFGYAEIYLPDEDAKDVKDEDDSDDPAIIIKVDDLVARVNLVDLVSATSPLCLTSVLTSTLRQFPVQMEPLRPVLLRSCRSRSRQLAV